MENFMHIWIYDYLYSFYYEYNKGKLAEKFSGICAVVASQVLHIFFLLFLIQIIFKFNILKQNKIPYEIGKTYLFIMIVMLFLVNALIYWNFNHRPFIERNNITGKFKIKDILFQFLIILAPLLAILIAGRF